MNKQTKKDLKIKELESLLEQYKSNTISGLHISHSQLKRLLKSTFKASGVIVEIKTITGDTLVNPFMCRDGLTEQTINNLLDQIITTQNYDLDFLIKKDS